VKPLTIGDLAISPPLVLAPMAGVTDRRFRLLVRRLGGVGLVTGEFVSAEAARRGIAPIVDKLRCAPGEHPVAVQLYGEDPEAMGQAAALAAEFGADVCDINMGCPVRKIVRRGGGAALLGDVVRAGRIVAACRRRLTIPLTVKLRAGLVPGERPPRCFDVARACAAEGADAVTLHPRTAADGYGGRADWRLIGALRASLAIPVIGNGDVRSAADAARMVRETGADGVMIGRAVLEDPWIFARAVARLQGVPEPESGPAAHGALIRSHLASIAREEAPRVAVHQLRAFLGRTSRGLPQGVRLRRQLEALREPQEFLDLLDEHLAASGSSPSAEGRTPLSRYER
jgi:nifR3 family TIM-barrel protein